jgi:hypothetical protein
MCGSCSSGLWRFMHIGGVHRVFGVVCVHSLCCSVVGRDCGLDVPVGRNKIALGLRVDGEFLADKYMENWKFVPR